MKQLDMEKQAKDQINQNFGDISSEIYQTTLKLKVIRTAVPNHPSFGWLLSLSKQRAGGRLCKGPPGQARSPGVGDGLFPDHPPDEGTNPVRFWIPIDIGTNRIEPSHEQALKNPSKGRSLSLSKGELNINTEIQIFNKNQNSNFLQTLKFIIMKKQILFLTFFVLAIFLAGTSMSYGQNTEEAYLTAAPTYCVPAVALVCGAGDALAPMPGVSYPYTITSSSVGTIHWFVTDDANIITTQGAIAAAIEPKDGTSPYILTADAAYNLPTNTSLTVNITWKSFNGTANNVILVAYNVDANGCTNNIEAYRIEPKYAFTLDLAGLLDDGTAGATECVVPIQSATYNGTDLAVDYGENYVFYTVNSANWQTSWKTNLVATTAAGGSTLGAVEWAYPDQASGATSVWNANGTDVLASHYASGADGFIDALGECIVVRVPVTHTGFENLANETINLVVNGEMINPQTTAYDGAYPDLDEPASGTVCASNLTTDNKDFVITPRPTVTETTPTPFENKTF